MNFLITDILKSGFFFIVQGMFGFLGCLGQYDSRENLKIWRIVQIVYSSALDKQFIVKKV